MNVKELLDAMAEDIRRKGVDNLQMIITEELYKRNKSLFKNRRGKLYYGEISVKIVSKNN